LDARNALFSPSKHWKNTVNYEFIGAATDALRLLTGQALSIFGICVKVFSVGDHAASQVGNWEGLFLIIALAALGDSFDVCGH
jgi:hypothetical protein